MRLRTLSIGAGVGEFEVLCVRDAPAWADGPATCVPYPRAGMPQLGVGGEASMRAPWYSGRGVLFHENRSATVLFDNGVSGFSF
jgi:hypothetical protein